MKQISVKVLKVELDKNYDFVLLDVRTKEEFNKTKIVKSINIPLTELYTIETIMPDKNMKLFVYCLSGSRSRLAVKTLEELGYKNVFDVKSGLLAWRSNKFKLD